MSDKLIELILSTGPSTLIILVALVWGKNLIEYFFSETIEIRKSELNQDLEMYKSNLAKEHANFSHTLNQELEIQKNSLDVLKQKYQIQFSKLHSERAEVIKNLYPKLIELHSAMLFFTRTIQPVVEDAEKEKKERIDRVNKAFVDFRDYYVVHKIYFTRAISGKIDKIMAAYYKQGDDYAYILRLSDLKNISQESYKIHSERMTDISKLVRNEFPVLIEKLEEDFRSILGVVD